MSRRGTGGGSHGIKGREAGEGRVGSGVLKMAGTGKNPNISLYFAIERGDNKLRKEAGEAKSIMS